MIDIIEEILKAEKKFTDTYYERLKKTMSDVKNNG